MVLAVVRHGVGLSEKVQYQETGAGRTSACCAKFVYIVEVHVVCAAYLVHREQAEGREVKVILLIECTYTVRTCLRTRRYRAGERDQGC